jgi:TATA-box binding protein (TBP) (component of TFIID and TFIIIB)
VSGHSKTRFKKLWSFSKELVNLNNNVLNLEVGSVVYKVRLTKGDKSVGGTVTIFSSGKIKLSGGFIDVSVKNTNSNAVFKEQPEIIRRYIIDNFTNSSNFTNKTINFNNIGGIFNINSTINLQKTHEKITRSQYEPELDPKLIVQLNTCKIQVSAGGIIQIKGMKNPVESFKEVLQIIKDKFVLRNPISLNNVKIKRGAGRIPRRVNNQPAPNVKRRGATCPPARRPTPFSFQGKCPEKHYVRPNPQGQPCCYKKPKSIKYLKNKVINNYRKANVKIPENVKVLFGITNNNNRNKNTNVATNVPNIKVVNDPKFGLKIDSRQCMRYTKVKLYEIATRLKIRNVNPKMPKEKLCDEIKKQAKKLNINNTKKAVGNNAISFTNNGKVYVITGTAKKLKLGRRLCHTYTKPTLLKFGRKFGLALDPKLSKEQMCQEFEKKVQSMRRRNENEQRRRNENEQRRRNENEQRRRNENERRRRNEENEKRRRINNLGLNVNKIVQQLPNLYGNNFMNNYGNEIRPTFRTQAGYLLLEIQQGLTNGRIRVLNNGIPNKASLDKFKQEVVNRWKKQTKEVYGVKKIFKTKQNARNNLRRLLGSNYNKVKNKISNQLVNQYIQKVESLILNNLSKQEIENRKKRWLYLERTYGNLKSPSPRRSPRMTGLNVEEI